MDFRHLSYCRVRHTFGRQRRTELSPRRYSGPKARQTGKTCQGSNLRRKAERRMSWHPIQRQKVKSGQVTNIRGTGTLLIHGHDFSNCLPHQPQTRTLHPYFQHLVSRHSIGLNGSYQLPLFTVESQSHCHWARATTTVVVDLRTLHGITTATQDRSLSPSSSSFKSSLPLPPYFITAARQSRSFLQRWLHITERLMARVSRWKIPAFVLSWLAYRLAARV